MKTVEALLNSGPHPERLRTPGDLRDFLGRWEVTGRRDGDVAELHAVRDLRERLRDLWDAGEDGRAETVNLLLERGDARPYLTRHGDWGWHLHATRGDRPLADRMAVEAAMAFVDIIRAGHDERLRRCEAPGCPGLFIDLTRNAGRRFCSPVCATRVTSARHRRRLRPHR
ncbi:MAG TPA: CGNR zinc finger domain-containing protein [Jiangellales bacterium]|nr:CGNR zinc finger domain-containing protein [Jiangellales bacterium]